MFLITEWKRKRDAIRGAPARAKKLDDEITEALYHYRIHLTELQIKPHLLDREIWESYDSILEVLGELKSRSEGRLLHRPSTLADLMVQWEKLFARQKQLLSTIDLTMERSEFYNKMETAKHRKHREQAQKAEAEAELSESRRSLIQAIHYVLLRERSGEPVTADSVVLDLDQAIDRWQEQLHEAISRVASEGPIKDKMRTLDQLRQRILEAPAWADKLKSVEEDLDELLELEDQLRRMTNRGQLSDADIDEMVNLLRIDAAESWAQADWEALESVIERIQTYVQRQYGHLQSELYVLRKRNGPARVNGRNTPLSQLAHSDASGADQSEASQEPTQSQPDKSQFSLLARAVRTRTTAAPYARTLVDPDADESVRRVFEAREGPRNEHDD